MRRMKWFLPADERPFNPLGSPCSDIDSAEAAHENRAGTPPSTDVLHGADPSGRNPAALPFQPCGPALRSLNNSALRRKGRPASRRARSGGPLTDPHARSQSLLATWTAPPTIAGGPQVAPHSRASSHRYSSPR